MNNFELKELSLSEKIKVEGGNPLSGALGVLALAGAAINAGWNFGREFYHFVND